MQVEFFSSTCDCYSKGSNMDLIGTQEEALALFAPLGLEQSTRSPAKPLPRAASKFGGSGLARTAAEELFVSFGLKHLNCPVGWRGAEQA
jgi:hypothetical protein